MLTAQVAPELRVSRDVPVESIAVLASRQSAVKQAVQAAEALVSPIDVFIAVVMLGHGDRIPAEVFRGCMQRGVMQPDFKSFPLEVLHPGAVGGLGTRAVVGGRSRTANRPYPLGGAEPEAGQEGVDLAAGFQGL